MIVFKILKGVSFTIKLYPVNWLGRKLVKRIIVRMYKPYVRRNIIKVCKLDNPFDVVHMYLREVNRYLPKRHHMTTNQFVFEYHYAYGNRIQPTPTRTMKQFIKDELRRCNDIIVAEANRENKVKKVA
jgi:hypothetical protein